MSVWLIRWWCGCSHTTEHTDDGWRTCLKHVEHVTEINTLCDGSCVVILENTFAMHGSMNIKN
jgi:hypothetical protein